MYLVDTSVITELRRGTDRSNGGVWAWADAEPPELMYTSAMCLFELEVAVGRNERSNPEHGARLRAWLDDQVRPQFRGRILPVTDEIVARAAALQIPYAWPTIECLIAATAAAHGFAVVTRHAADFRRVGAEVVDPWRA